MKKGTWGVLGVSGVYKAHPAGGALGQCYAVATQSMITIEMALYLILIFTKRNKKSYLEGLIVFSNAGFTVLVIVSVFIPILVLIALVTIMVGVFQMRRSMQNASDKLNDIYEFLLKQKESQ